MKELYSYDFLKIQIKLSVTEEKKQTPLPVYLKRTRFDFANAKQLVDSWSQETKKRLGHFAVVFLTAR